MLNQEKWKQYGIEGLVPNCITIHNTSNYEMNAQQIFDYMNNECETSQGCHFLVDDEGVIEVMPLNYKVWHTGKGNDYAFHNSIAIEICSNLDNKKYIKGEDNAIQVIKNLMETYNITLDEIYFHNDWNSKYYCPSNILDIYKTKENFKRRII